MTSDGHAENDAAPADPPIEPPSDSPAGDRWTELPADRIEDEPWWLAGSSVHRPPACESDGESIGGSAGGESSSAWPSLVIVGSSH